MGKQAGAIRDAGKAVEQPGIAHVDFRRLQLPFAAVGVPGLQTANHGGAAEEIEITARGGLRSTEGASELGAVPDLAMKMGDHRPEAPERLGGSTDSELWQILLEKGAQDVASPAGAGGVGGRQK